MQASKNIITVTCPACRHREDYTEELLVHNEWTVECPACGDIFDVGEEVSE